jgi:hypothetical protein
MMTNGAAEIIDALRAFNRPNRAVGTRAIGSKNGAAVFTEEQVYQIKRLIELGVRPKVIMRKFSRLNYKNYWRIMSGQTWRHVP